ncbi:trypsin-like serine protease [Hyalangium versicolor]|uniref:trypsin-like serine protease n=1 Tax=Hyalangium versicolor TaxID=2861190 RepID=UPI001CCAF963|nr:trypsin-like serine protease [Hyalangium versicolor]
MGLPPNENSASTALVASLLLLSGACAPNSASVLALASGVDDYANQYRSTVQVYSRARECTGVLIELHMVLTSADCFCLPPDLESRSGPAVFTPADCEQKTFVHVVRYVRQWDGQWRGIPESFEGTVTVHEGFRVEFRDGKVLTHVADLAVVEMEYSMLGVTADGNLPQAEVTPQERLVQVGFSPSVHVGDEEEVRRFGGIVVTAVTTTRETSEVHFRTSGVQGLSGNSGGPAFRETAKGRWLVGINSGLTRVGEGARFTSTFQYRDWVERQKSR